MGSNMKKNIHKICLAFVLSLVSIMITTMAYAVNITTYNGEHGMQTIYWTRGITPPVMGDYDQHNAGDFVLCHESYVNNKRAEYYVTPFVPGKGWFDLNKADKNNMCFALASSNILHWWIETNKDVICENLEKGLKQDEEYAGKLVDPNSITQWMTPPTTQDNMTSDLYSKLVKKVFGRYHQIGYYPEYVIDFFINGYSIDNKSQHGWNIGDQHKPSVFNPDNRGGFFVPIFGLDCICENITSSNSNFTNIKYSTFNKVIKEKLNDGYGIVITFKYGLGGAHAITLWGAEYNDSGKMEAIYITDSDDYMINVPDTDQPIGMKRVYVRSDYYGDAVLAVDKKFTKEVKVNSLHMLPLKNETLTLYAFANLEEIKAKKIDEINSICFTEEDLQELYEENIERAKQKLLDVQKSAEIRIKNADTADSVNSVVIDKNAIISDILEEQKRQEEMTLLEAISAKRKEINAIEIPKKYLKGKTIESIDAAREKLKEMKDAAIDELDYAGTIEEVNEAGDIVKMSEVICLLRKADVEQPPFSGDSDGGGGCNAGLGSLILLAFAPILFRKRDN